MPTTVRVEDDVKEGLDRLQGLIQSETGERLTHSQLLARLVRVGRKYDAELLLSDEQDRRTPEEVRRFLSRIKVHGVRTNVRDMDEGLYGERP